MPCSNNIDPKSIKFINIKSIIVFGNNIIHYTSHTDTHMQLTEYLLRLLIINKILINFQYNKIQSFTRERERERNHKKNKHKQ